MIDPKNRWFKDAQKAEVINVDATFIDIVKFRESFAEGMLLMELVLTQKKCGMILRLVPS